MSCARCFCILLYLLATFYVILPSAQSNNVDCCVSFAPGTFYDELLIMSNFRTLPEGSGWELSANVSWTPSPDYNGYDMEFELVSVEEVGYFHCIEKYNSCYAENETGYWRVYRQLQFGSTYRIKIFVSEVADHIRGPYLSGFAVSPDCIDETNNIDFCRNQSVGYIGKPFNITVDVQRIDKTNDVTVHATWRQPIHINPDIELDYYDIAWVSNGAGSDRMTYSNITYEPGGYLTIKLSTYLQENKNYTLIVSPVIIEDDTLRYKSAAEIVFSTDLPEVAEPNGDGFLTVITGMSIGGGVLLTIGIAIIIYVSKANKHDEDTINMMFIPDECGIDAITDLIGYPEYEISRDDITWEKRILLGSGHYGEVYKCKVQTMHNSEDVAVKLPKQMATAEQLADFVEEIKQIVKLGSHENIVRFVGYNTEANPLMLINEFVQYGDMLRFLYMVKHKTAPKDDPMYAIELINQLELARQICKGMAYISSKHLFHGDLAARNILIGKDSTGGGLLAKITDFGLSIDICERNYHRIKSLDLPWRWQAIEALTEHKVSTESDVWSFGIVLTEIFKFCDPRPYEKISKVQELIDFLKADTIPQRNRMSRPPSCPEYMYRMMLRCWNKEPSLRPTFDELYIELKDLTDLYDRSKAEGGDIDNQYHHGGSHVLAEALTSGSSCGGTEFIRASGSDENGTDSYKSNESTKTDPNWTDRRLQSDKISRRLHGSGYQNLIEDGAAIDALELIDDGMGSGSFTGYLASNEEQDQDSSAEQIPQKVAEQDTKVTTNNSTENINIPKIEEISSSLPSRQTTENGQDNFGFNVLDERDLDTTNGELSVSGEFCDSDDSGLIITHEPLHSGDDNFENDNPGFRVDSEETTTGGPCTITGGSCVSSEYIRVSSSADSALAIEAQWEV